MIGCINLENNLLSLYQVRYLYRVVSHPIECLTNYNKCTGTPRVWNNKSVPFSCTPDKGYSFVDQTGYHCPSSPLTPLVTAVREHSPSFNLDQVDLVTDRNNLRKLLGWVSNSGKYREFRIDVQRTGRKTVLFTRWEPRNRVKAHSGPAGATGYGSTFEKIVTRHAIGAEPTLGHHRIITYVSDKICRATEKNADTDQYIASESRWTSTAGPL